MSERLSPDAPRTGTTLSYLPALDGIRGVGMLNIMGVHGGVWLTAGGFYILDSFFALSGFLITSLLIAEWRTSGTVKLAAFWSRRARRLLPGLFVMLLGVAVLYGLFVAPGTYPTLRGDALSVLFYFANWHYIVAGSNYFNATGLPSPLIHTWSLSVEEQFYLLWPLVFLAVMTIWKSVRALLIVSVAGALLSALEMALLFNHTDLTRLYFGTDTHMQSVLVGVAVAAGLALWAERRRKGNEQDWKARTSWARVIFTALGVAGIAGTALMYIFVNSSDAFTYRGGFLVASLAASAVLLSVACAPRSPVAKLLSFPVITFVGRISYGMYLWHLPLFFFIDHARTGLSGWALLVVRVIPTMVLAAASFFLVERPIRRGTFFSSIRAFTVVVPTVAVVVVATLLATLPATASVTGGDVATGGVPATALVGAVPGAERHAPVRVLLVGDSQALTLGIGLQAAVKADPVRYDNMDILDEGIPGCGVADGTTGVQRGTQFLVGWPCTPYPQRGNCPPGGIYGADRHVPCQSWTKAWAQWVQEMKPNVVVYLGGGGEVLDRQYQGRTTTILDPTFAAYVKSQLEKAVRIATAGGADMVFMTKPCQSTGEQPNGDPWPEDSAARQKLYNSLLRQVAAAHPSDVDVQDLNAYVCPDGTYHQDLHGVPVRASDGVHFDYTQPHTGGAYLAPAILPYWEELGHLQEAKTGGASINQGVLPIYFAPQ